MENCPSITLRKGKTEIKIENAATVIKKINEMYPSKAEYDGWYYAPSWNKKQKRTEAEIERQRQWIESAKDWFKNEMFSGTGSFEVVVEDSKNEPVAEQKNTPYVSPFPGTEYSDPYVYRPLLQSNIEYGIKQEESISHQKEIRSVSKNAYELRTDILAMTLDWIKWKTDKQYNTYLTPEQLPNNENVLEIAKKFYSFVENRRY